MNQEKDEIHLATKQKKPLLFRMTYSIENIFFCQQRD